MDEMLKDLNGPWSNAACMGYCLIAMRRAGLRPRHSAGCCGCWKAYLTM